MKAVYILTISIKGQPAQLLIFQKVATMEKTVKLFATLMTAKGRKEVSFHMERHTVYTDFGVVDELMREVIHKLPH